MITTKVLQLMNRWIFRSALIMSCDDHSFHTKRFGNTKTCIWLTAASYDWMNSTYIQAWSQVQVLSNVYFRYFNDKCDSTCALLKYFLIQAGALVQ